MINEDEMWQCPYCECLNYVVYGLSCRSCGRCLVKHPVYGEVFIVAPKPTTEECFVAPKDVLYEDKKDFLEQINDWIFEKMKKYNEQEEEKIRNGKETKEYIKIDDIMERMRR